MHDGEQGQEGSATGQANDSDRDPLGRAPNGTGVGDRGMRLDGTSSGQMRARELFDEIRRRADDPNRPEAEREYLRRLLDTFDAS
jgi:hypothetical protein